MMRIVPAALLLGGALSAHALTPGSGAWVKESATYGTPNLQDAYVYVPKNASPAVKAGKRALMLSLHGCGQTASGNVIDNKYHWEPVAEQYGMVVIAPTVPTGTSGTRAVSGCWDWFGTGQSRTTRDNLPLKKLLDAVRTRSELDIDPNQIYVTGLSSGGGQTLAMACAFPDVFAGFGSNAGPTIGAAAGDISVAPKISAAQVAANCKSYSGSAYASYYDTQIAAVVYGSADTLVLPAHNVRNIEGMGALYGVSMSNPTTTSVPGGGSAKVYKDANGRERLSDMVVDGMSHAWPAGPGATKYIAFVDSDRVNYPVYITDWLFKNNLRVVVIAAPAGVTVGSATDHSLTVSWNAVSGATGYNVYRDGSKVASVSGTSYADSGLSGGSTYTYTVTATANGSESVKSAAVQGTTTGTPPVLGAPGGLAGTSPATGTVALTWNVVSGAKNYNVYRNGGKIGSPTSAGYTDSGLASGNYSYAVSAVNSANVEGAQSAPITVSPVAYSQAVTDSVVNHYNAKRLKLNQYLGLGAKIGYTASVTLYNCGGTWTNQANCGPMAY
ncbi:MAG: PHB depolymerase family esterase [Betaproteobacteria bacterium]